jgi:hypothetical protein
MCTGSPAHRRYWEILPNQFEGVFESPFADKADVALNIDSCRACQRARRFHLAKGNIFVVGNDAARCSLTAFFLINQDDAGIFPFGNSAARAYSSTDRISTVMT